MDINNLTENIDTGYMEVDVTSFTTNAPIEDAVVTISYTGTPDSAIEELTTDISGQTPTVELRTPPLELSMEPSNLQPYSEFTVTVNAPGFFPLSVSGSDVLAGQITLQPIRLFPLELQNTTNNISNNNNNINGYNSSNIVIPANTLFGNYPPKIAEAEIKPVNDPGEIVLSRVVVPEYIVVHDGVPTDTTATNYYVRYRDYIKNVASSEIYSTWPDATIYANVLAIMSFTLNRVYTEWYRNRGYEFTITSSTAFDHKWIYGRNIFENISQIVDDIFANYLSRPNVKQPILTQYCDGKKVTCPRWMSQWGSKYLGDQNYTAIEILRNYYGDDMYINTAEEVSGIPSSWPGYDLEVGSRGDDVAQIQEQLNVIRNNYNAIPSLTVDGIFGPNTEAAVREFQRIFKLPVSGIVDYPTWYKISDMYVRLSRIGELY